MSIQSKNQAGIRRKLTLFICLGTLIIVSVGIGIRYTFGYNLLLTLEAESRLKMAQALSLNIKQVIDANNSLVDDFLTSEPTPKSRAKLSKLFETLVATALGGYGHIVLVDDKGEILFHPQKNLLGSRFVKEEVIDKMIKDKWAAVILPNIYLDEVFITFSVVNHKTLWAHKKMWKVFVVQDFEEVLEPLNGMTRQATILAAVLILFLIPLGFVFSLLFTKPIKRLWRAARQVKEGKEYIPIKLKTGDEIQELAEAFNDMVATIEKNKKEILREKAYIESAIKNILTGIAMIDIQGNLVVINPQTKELLGFSASQDIAADVLIRRMQVIGVDKLIDECKISNQLKGKDIVLPWGENRVLRCEAAPVKESKGELVGVLVTLLDITQDKLIDQMKTDFVSLVSHELRTPLATIKEGVSLVLDKALGETTPAQAKILTVSHTNISRLERIINELLDVSKIEAGKMELHRQAVNLADVINGVVVSFELRMKDKGLSFKINIEPKDIRVYIDSDKITEVFTNLVGNAMKFTEKGCIEISAQNKETTVECFVADSGIGIAKKDLSSVFGKFEQFTRASGPGEKGTGLGLSIAKGIVEMHKGEIKVESELGRGTKFVFTIPHYSAQEVVLDDINKKIASFVKDKRDFTLFINKFVDCADLEAMLGPGRCEEVLQKIAANFEKAVKKAEIAILSQSKEIVVLTDVGKYEAWEVSDKLKRIIKESVFELVEGKGVNFTYGYAIFPADAGNAENLIEAARKNSINEHQKQLEKKIMIVDDEPQIIKSVIRMLETWGYSKVISAGAGQEALELINKDVPDLLILDMKLPDMSGYEIIGRVKEAVRTAKIPILIMSGYEVEADRLKEYIKSKAILVVGKPIQLEQLEKLVSYLL